MSTAEEIVAALRASAELVALAGDRVHPNPAPSGQAAPFVTYQRIGGEPDHYTIEKVRGPIVARYQIDAWAGDYPTMRALVDAVIAAVEDLASALIAGTFYTAERESYDPAARLHRCAIEFDLHERR